MKDIKAFCFDVFGTVVDWRTGIAREADVFLSRLGVSDYDPYQFADAWRNLYQPSMEKCRSGKRPFTRLDILHRENLETVLIDYGIKAREVDPAELAQFNCAWHRLDPWPDVVSGLTRLKKKHIIAPASNGNIALMVDMAKRSAIPWDVILGAEVTQAYKPTAAAYTRMADILDVNPDQICMVAAHNNDLNAARECGLATAFVARPTEHGPSQTKDLRADQAWDIVAHDFNDLAARVGC